MSLDPAPTHDSREAGGPPYWQPGEVVSWVYRHPSWTPGAPCYLHPTRVVRDDADGLVVWLAEGTPALVPRQRDGRDGRQLPLSERFSGRFLSSAVQARSAWRGPGVLRIAPTGAPWSCWLFHEPDGRFAGWYVNLESPHRRTEDATLSSDHVLDVEMQPGDERAHWKDEDELAACVEQGRYTAAEAAQIRRNGEVAVAAWRSGHWAFGEEWTRWRPPADWSVPGLPDDARWELDLT